MHRLEKLLHIVFRGWLGLHLLVLWPCMELQVVDLLCDSLDLELNCCRSGLVDAGQNIRQQGKRKVIVLRLLLGRLFVVAEGEWGGERLQHRILKLQLHAV